MSKAIAVNSPLATEIATKLEAYEQENAKFEGGNKSAATRARKLLQEIRVLAQAGRQKIIENKKKPSEEAA